MTSTRRQLGPTAVARVHAAAQIARAGQRLVLRLQTHKPAEIRNYLGEALAYTSLAHVVVEAGSYEVQGTPVLAEVGPKIVRGLKAETSYEYGLGWAASARHAALLARTSGPGAHSLNR